MTGDPANRKRKPIINRHKLTWTLHRDEVTGDAVYSTELHGFELWISTIPWFEDSRMPERSSADHRKTRWVGGAGCIEVDLAFATRELAMDAMEALAKSTVECPKCKGVGVIANPRLGRNR